MGSRGKKIDSQSYTRIYFLHETKPDLTARGACRKRKQLWEINIMIAEIKHAIEGLRDKAEHISQRIKRRRERKYEKKHEKIRLQQRPIIQPVRILETETRQNRHIKGIT